MTLRGRYQGIPTIYTEGGRTEMLGGVFNGNMATGYPTVVRKKVAHYQQRFKDYLLHRPQCACTVILLSTWVVSRTRSVLDLT